MKINADIPQRKNESEKLFTEKAQNTNRKYAKIIKKCAIIAMLFTNLFFLATKIPMMLVTK